MTKELLEKYPKSLKIVKNWCKSRYLEGIEKNSFFYDSFSKREIPNEELLQIINSSPRALFDIFDKNNIYIQISIDIENGYFRYSFNGGKVESCDFYIRVAAEKESILKAFELLEDKL